MSCVLNVKIGRAKSMPRCHFCKTKQSKADRKDTSCFLPSSTFTSCRNSLVLANTCCTPNHCHTITPESHGAQATRLKCCYFDDYASGMTFHIAGHTYFCLIHKSRSLSISKQHRCRSLLLCNLYKFCLREKCSND